MWNGRKLKQCELLSITALAWTLFLNVFDPQVVEFACEELKFAKDLLHY
jgi:hypothetical protein